MTWRQHDVWHRDVVVTSAWHRRAASEHVVDTAASSCGVTQRQNDVTAAAQTTSVDVAMTSFIADDDDVTLDCTNAEVLRVLCSQQQRQQRQQCWDRRSRLSDKFLRCDWRRWRTDRRTDGRRQRRRRMLWITQSEHGPTHGNTPLVLLQQLGLGGTSN